MVKNTKKRAPVCVFAYNRPAHLEKTLISLYECHNVGVRQTYLFCDGPKGPEQKSNVEAVRAIAMKYSKHSGLVAQFSQKNQGLASSIVRGINYVLQEHDSVIVVEDDIVLSTQALAYFDEMLRLYEENERIFSISTYCPPHLQNNIPLYYTESVFGIPRMQCWGWATWKSKWSYYGMYKDYFETLEKSELLLNRYRTCIGRDSLDNLRNTMLRDKDLWACKWVLTHFMNNALCICPRFSLSKNIGLDGSGSNCGVGPVEEFQFQDLDLNQPKLIIKNEIDLEIFKRFMSAYNQEDDVLIEYLTPYGVKN